MLGSRQCVYLTSFLVILRFVCFFLARPVGLYGARVSVLCALSGREKGVKKNQGFPFCATWYILYTKAVFSFCHADQLGHSRRCAQEINFRELFKKKIWFINVYLYILTLKPLLELIGFFLFFLVVVSLESLWSGFQCCLYFCGVFPGLQTCECAQTQAQTQHRPYVQTIKKE